MFILDLIGTRNDNLFFLTGLMRTNRSLRDGSRGSILTLELFLPSRIAMNEMVNLIYHSDGSFVIRSARPFLDLHAKLLTSR